MPFTERSQTSVQRILTNGSLAANTFCLADSTHAHFSTIFVHHIKMKSADNLDGFSRVGPADLSIHLSITSSFRLLPFIANMYSYLHSLSTLSLTVDYAFPLSSFDSEKVLFCSVYPISFAVYRYYRLRVLFPSDFFFFQ